jgi:hypothetical protein
MLADAVVSLCGRSSYEASECKGARNASSHDLMLNHTEVKIYLGLFFGVALTLSPLQAQWNRYLPNDGGNDTPDPHHLKYFTHDAMFRGPYDARDSCDGCTPEETVEIGKKGRADVVKIGELNGFEVQVVTYSCSCTQAGGPWKPAKSLIVRTGPDEFRELLYVRQFDQFASFPDPAIVRADENHALLWLWVDEGGNKHPVEDYYFRFDSNGPARVDLEPVWESAYSAGPVGAMIFKLDPHLGTYGIGIFTLLAQVYNDSGVAGNVEVDFKLDGNRVTVLGRRFIP